MVIIFEDEKQADLMGAAIFQRGLNGLWRMIKLEYSVGMAVQQITTSDALRKNTVVYTAYYAVNLRRTLELKLNICSPGMTLKRPYKQRLHLPMESLFTDGYFVPSGVFRSALYRVFYSASFQTGSSGSSAHLQRHYVLACCW